ncbi:uncharacterized protein J3R85_003254 [Psidium guajava]|nr:uncharacterized protein J3R85_003254 [Psidium guajava]
MIPVKFNFQEKEVNGQKRLTEFDVFDNSSIPPCKETLPIGCGFKMQEHGEHNQPAPKLLPHNSLPHVQRPETGDLVPVVLHRHLHEQKHPEPKCRVPNTWDQF